jgi:hypothetical protein
MNPLAPHRIDAHHRINTRLFMALDERLELT